MNKKIKAALLSTIVFPGAGQLLLKRHLFGGILAGVAFISFSIILVSTLKRSLIIAEKIQTGEIPFDVMAISNLILEQPAASTDNFFINAAWLSLIIVWLISLVDSLTTANVNMTES